MKNLYFLTIMLLSMSANCQNLFEMSSVQDIRIVFSRNDWDFLLDSMAQAGDDYSVANSVSINGTTFTNADVKYKGNSTYNPNNLKNPLAATTVNSGDLVINEFMAADSTAIADQNGEFDDWIEIYNNTALPISLNGFYLSDNFGNPQKWQFPDTTIAANGYMIVWADNDSFQSGLHAYFKLSASGEEIMLSANNGTVLDSVTYGAQLTDVSLSRIPNGTGAFTATAAYTFSANNDNTSVDNLDKNLTWSLRLYPNPNSSGLQFLELQSADFGDFQYEVFDNLGRSLFQKQLSNVQGQYVEQFSTANWVAGSYFVRVIAGKDSRVLKLQLN